MISLSISSSVRWFIVSKQACTSTLTKYNGGLRRPVFRDDVGTAEKTRCMPSSFVYAEASTKPFLVSLEQPVYPVLSEDGGTKQFWALILQGRQMPSVTGPLRAGVTFSWSSMWNVACSTSLTDCRRRADHEQCVTRLVGMWTHLALSPALA